MAWYDFFALFYDRSLEDLYRPYRKIVVDTLAPTPGDRVLDLACGTGQNFDSLVEAIGSAGEVVGVDASEGMLKQARRRIESNGWKNVRLVRADAAELDAATPGATESFDAVVCTLGLTAIPDWKEAFARSFALLRPGGRYVIFDVHAEKRLFQTRTVELVARADLSREVWRPLAAAADGFERRTLDGDPKTFGGTLFVATGIRPSADA